MSKSTNVLPIMARLKAETQALHERVERCLDLEASLASLDAYAGLLARFLGLYRPLERDLVQVSGRSSFPIDFDQRRKTPLLKADLQSLGWSDAQIAATPDCPTTPAIDSLTTALGTMYVLEGSTLGSQIIRRAVHTRLGLTPAVGCAFFSAYGDQVGRLWLEFKNAIAGHAAREECGDALVAHARRTFEAFESWLQPNADSPQ